MTTENVTVLFTDLVGSTQLQSSVTPDVADAIRRDHFTVLRRSISETGGREVKNLGDGLMVVFASASAAIACAVSMQQGVEHDSQSRPQEIGLRVGVSSGEVTFEDDDYFGDPVIEAARLCARCAGGQILASDLVRLNAGRRNPHPSSPVGELELKGLPDPVATVEVHWEPVVIGRDSEPALPGLLTEAGRFPFAGRQKEAEQLLGAYGTVSTGATRLVLVAGEPGIGKTRLTSELAGRVVADGGAVLAGRSDELVGVPYQPFVEALRWQLLQPDGSADLGPGAGELVRLVPELAQVVPDLRPPVTASPESERMSLFEAVRGWFGAVAAERPILLALDDLHWSDLGTLLLVRHLVVNDPVPRLLVVGTYRDTDLDRTHPLSTVLAEFHRRGDVERIALSGLDENGVTDLMARTAGHELDEAGIALAMSLQEDTGGNPFFVGEVLRHLAESGSIAQQGGRWVAGGDASERYLPEGIRQVVGRRISVLPSETQRLLGPASVIGARFGLELLAAVTEMRPDDVLDALEPALDAHLLLETGFGRYQFAHALVRSTLHGELSTTRRGRLHLAVAEGLEKLHVGNLDDVMADLAYHWGEAGTSTVDDVAFTYARRAAALAMEQASPDEAARWFRIARERLDRADPVEDADLLLQLGLAESAMGASGWQQTLIDAARAGMLLGDLRLVADALGHSQRIAFTTSALMPADTEKIELLEQAIEQVSDDPFLAARLTFELATEVLIGGDLVRRDQLFEQAMVLRGDVAELADRVHLESRSFPTVSNWSVTSEDLLRRISEVTQLLDQPPKGIDPHRIASAMSSRTWAAFNIRPQDRWAYVEAIEAFLGEHPDPVAEQALLVTRTEALLIDGRFNEVMASADACERIATTFDNPDYRVLADVLRIECIRELTGFGPFVDVLIDSLADLPGDDSPSASAALRALVLAESGRLAEAAELIAERGHQSFDDIPDDASFAVSLPCWSEAAAMVQDRGVCRALLALVERLDDPFFVTGSWFGGSTMRIRAILTAALGEEDASEQLFGLAVAAFEEAQSPPWLARTRVDWAEHCLALGNREQGTGTRHSCGRGDRRTRVDRDP